VNLPVEVVWCSQIREQEIWENGAQSAKSLSQKGIDAQPPPLPTQSRSLETKKSNLLLTANAFEEIKEVEEEYNCPSSMNLNSGETFRRQRIGDKTPEHSGEKDLRSSWHFKQSVPSEFKTSDIYDQEKGGLQGEYLGVRSSFIRTEIDSHKTKGSPDSKENYLYPSDKKSFDSASKMCFANFRKLKASKLMGDKPPSHLNPVPRPTNPNSSTAGVSGTTHAASLFKSITPAIGGKQVRKSPQIDPKRRSKNRIYSPCQNNSLASTHKRDTASFSLNSVGSPQKDHYLKGTSGATSLSVKKSRKRDAKISDHKARDDGRPIDLKLFRDSVSGNELKEQLSQTAHDDGSVDTSKVCWFLKRSSKKVM